VDISLEHTARTNAWLEGQDDATPDDVRAMVHGVLRHRLILSYAANANAISADQAIDKLGEVVAVPRKKSRHKKRHTEGSLGAERLRSA